MDAKKLGAAIRSLRIREGYTQQELAEFLSVTDKAVSKWERGLSVPDISNIAHLAGILNTDVDNLLEGNISYLQEPWHGILKLAPMEDYLHCDSPVYGKPMIEFWLSYFLLAGIREISLEGPVEELERAERLLGDGSQLGVRLAYSEDTIPVGRNEMIVWDNIFLYGSNLTRYLQRAMSRHNGISVLSAECTNPGHKAVVFCNQDKRVSLKRGKEKYACYLLPVLFLPKQYCTALTEEFCSIQALMQKGPVYTEVAGRGLVFCRLQNRDEIADVSEWIRLTEKMTESKIYDLHEIAESRELITKKIE